MAIPTSSRGKTSAALIDWSDIDTVLLDMDGVLLDLRYDNWFWRDHVPACYAARHDVTLEEAKSRVYPKMRAVRGTIYWYCADYWSDTLDLDIVQMKSNSAHLVSLRPQVVDFLVSLRKVVDALHLVTNAHRKAIEVKFAQTGLGGYFDEIICAHDYGVPKEDTSFWAEIRRRHDFDPSRTLFIDDNPDVLSSAREFGVSHLLGVRQPDSGAAVKDFQEFDAIHSFAEIMP